MKRVLLLTTIGVLYFVASTQAQNVFNPADPIVRYSSGQPVGSAQNPNPNINGLQKWVTTSTNGVSTGGNSFDASSFKAYYMNVNGLRMPFRLKFPRSYSNPDSAGKKYPIMVFFHGAGEPGCSNNNYEFNNEKQLLHGGRLFRDRVDNGSFDGFLLYPQLVDYQDCWSQWGSPPSAGNIAVVIQIIDSVAKYARADINKVVTTGLSDGGAAAWNMATVYPQRVAKAAPSAASTGATNYLEFVHIPIWFASGGKDTNPPPTFSNGTYNTVKNNGGDITYTLFPDLGHSVWYEHWQLPGFAAWMADLDKANPLVYFQRYDWCPDSAISAKIGITRGFYQYEWQRDGQPLATATFTGTTTVNGVVIYNYSTTIQAPAHVISYTGNDVTVRSFGTYRVRFRRTNGGEWSNWSPKPAVIYPKTVTNTPAIAINGLRSKVVPAPDGSTNVPLLLPTGYTRYEWYRGGVQVSTDRTINAIPGIYTAKAFEQFGCGSIASPAFSVVGANGEPKPDPATNLTATVEDLVNVRLAWNQNPTPGTNETGFEIYRSTGGAGGPYQLLTITAADVTSYLDENLASNKDFYYIVRAVSDFGASANTNEATTKTPIDNVAPSAPSNLTAVCVTRDKVTLNWTASTDNVSVGVYDIYVNGQKAYSTPNTRFEIFQLTGSTAYTFTVKAVDPTGNASQPSNQVAAYTRQQGVCYKVYAGEWDVLPNFNLLTPVKEGMSATIDLSVRPTGLDDNFGILWEGHMTRTLNNSPVRFRMGSDDGSRFYFNSYYNPNSTGLIDLDGLHGLNNPLVVAGGNPSTMNSGVPYPFALAYFERTGDHVMTLQWKVNSANDNTYATIPSTAFNRDNTPGSAPAAPTNLQAAATSFKQINLTWNDNSGANETGFELVRATAAAGPFLPLATVPANTTSFQDTGLNASTQYWYRVRSIGNAGPGASAFTNPAATATTQAPPPPPNAPSGLTATTPALSTVNLQWNDNSTNETSFEVWRSVGNNTSYSLLGTIVGGAGATKQFVDAPVFANVHYFYKVRSVGATASAYSNEATATTANSAPVFNNIPDFTVRQGQSVTVPINATDVDGDPLTFDIPGLPYFATIETQSNGNANLVVSPPEGEQGGFTLRAIVDDGFGGKDTVRFTVVVNDNALPVLNPISDVTINEGDSVTVALTATDAEMQQYFVWTMQNKPNFVTFTNNGNGSGSLKIKPGYAASGLYQMTVVVDDGFGAWVSRTFNIIVNERDPNDSWQINFLRFTGNVPLWNDVNVFGVSSFNRTNMTNKKGQATTVGVRSVAGGGTLGSSDQGMQPGGTGIFPDAIMKDQMWIGHNGGTDVGQIQVYNLDPAKKYNFVFFASINNGIPAAEPWRGYNANTKTTYTINGQSAEVFLLGNSNNTDTIYQVSPNASGVVTITLTGDPSNGVGAILNAMVVDAQVDDGSTPAKPANLAAQVVPNEGVRLTWTDVAFNENLYRVYRATNRSGPYTMLSPNAAKDSITYLDPNVAPYTQYFYYVRGENHLGLGISSDTASAITGNNKPVLTGLTNLFVKTAATAQDDFSVSDHAGDVITVSILNKPAFVTLTSLGGNNYRISASPSIDNVGWHYMTVQAADNNGGVVTQQVSVQVADANTRSFFVNLAYNVPAPAPWNNHNGYGNAGSVINNLRDETNAATTYQFQLVDGWDGVTEWGHRTGNNSGVFPDSVLAAGLFDDGNGTLRVRFNNLNNAMRYNVSLLGSQNDGITAVARYASGTQVDTLNARNNTNGTANLNGLTPASGVIEIAITKVTGTYIFLNGIQLEEYNPAITLMSPANLYVEGRTNSSNTPQATLIWSDRSSNETGFQVQRATDAAFTQNATLSPVYGPGTSSLSATGLTNNLTANTKYWYRVRAVNGGTNSDWSNKVSLVAPQNSVNIDFNFTNATSPATWNNLDALPNFNTTFTGLLNTANQPSGITLTIDRIFNSEYPGSIGSSLNANVVPDDVLETSYWIDRGQVATVRLGGLNQSKRYRIGFTGWVDNTLFGGNDFTMTYTINGRTVYLNTHLNLTKMVWIANIQPDANGEVKIDFSSPDRASMLYGFTSGMIIQSYEDVPGGGTQLNVVDPVINNPGVVVNQGATAENEQTAELTATQIRMYPNPFAQQVNLDFSNSAAGNQIAVEVYDMSGRVVYSKNYGQLPVGFNTLRVNTAAARLNTGYYMVALKVNGLPVQTTKMIKDRN